MMQTPPIRPPYPLSGDQARATRQAIRRALLEGDTGENDKLVTEFIGQYVDPEVLATWGPPDISADTISGIAQQLSTPGLYAEPPKITHPDLENELLTGPEGIIAQSGYWGLAPYVQFLAIGVGDAVVMPDYHEGSLVIREIPVHDICIECDPVSGQPVKLYWLRLRYIEQLNQYKYCYDVYDLGERVTKIVDDKLQTVEIRPPSWRVIEVEGEQTDWSNVFLGVPGGLVGDKYPFKKRDGTPVFRHVFYHEQNTGRAWHDSQARRKTRGGLLSVMLSTFTLRCARDASGTSVLAVGVSPPAGEIRDSGLTTSRKTMQLSPGSIAFLQAADDGRGQPTIQQIGPGANLDSLSAYQSRYEAQQLLRAGIQPSDIQRVGNDPQSGAALAINQAGRRQVANLMRPAFVASDLRLIEACAVVCRYYGLGDFADDGYRIEHYQIPVSPQDQQAAREEADWELSKGLRSRVGEYQRRHPGATREQAIHELAQIQAEEALISTLARQMGAPAEEDDSSDPPDNNEV